MRLLSFSGRLLHDDEEEGLHKHLEVAYNKIQTYLLAGDLAALGVSANIRVLRRHDQVLDALDGLAL